MYPALALLMASSLSPTETLKPVAHWELHPVYALPGTARNTFGRDDLVRQSAGPEGVGAPNTDPRFRRQEATDRMILAAPTLSGPDFTVEMWVMHHVDRPVGALVGHLDPMRPQAGGWSLGYWDKTATFTVGSTTLAGKGPERGWEVWWHHVVAVREGSLLRMYWNGQLAGVTSIIEALPAGPDAVFGLWGYLATEPEMQVGNLVRELALFPLALSAEQVNQRFVELKEKASSGRLYNERFHWTAPPKLQMPTQEGITVVFETDRPSTGTLELMVEKADTVTRSIPLDQPKDLHEVQLTGLAAGRPYFYRIRLQDGRGGTLDTGVLSFKTAPPAGQAIGFSFIADTETRPHVNDRIAKMLWGERPDFVIVGGDLTDGGQTNRRFEWTYEYLLAMGQLFSRVPSVPVVGNGESDLRWFTRYHAKPQPEYYYRFSYSDLDVFVVDSNRPLGPGTEQHAWLDRALGESKARWKVVTFHHCPYSSDENDHGDAWKEPTTLGITPLRDAIAPLMDRHRVDLVLYGHVHSYERTWPLRNGRVSPQDGTVYLQVGGAGGNLEDFAPTRSWFTKMVYRGHHYAMFKVFEGTLEARVVDLDGVMRDQFTLRKGN